MIPGSVKLCESPGKAGGLPFINYIALLSENEHHENWRSLYRLPPAIIRILLETPLPESHRAFIQKLPKADLHRHLGGCLDIGAQRRVGRAIWEDLGAPAKDKALETVRAWLQCGQWPEDWPRLLKNSARRSECCAALLVEATDQQLENNLYGATTPRIGLKDNHKLGFAAYELPGELSGSALLTHPAALESYIEEVVKQAAAEGLSYVELRGSPQKYGGGADFLRRLDRVLGRSMATVTENHRPEIRFIVIGDRRAPENLSAIVEMTVCKERLSGIDRGPGSCWR